MYSICRLRCHPLVVSLSVAGVLLWHSQPLLALDLSSSGPGEEQPQVPASRSGQLPSLAGVAKAAMPAVVNISTTQKVERRRRRRPAPMPEPNPFGGEDPFEEFFRRFFGDRPPLGQQRSLGSGFLVSEDGYIVTNSHVIDAADKVTVRLSDEEEYKAKVIGSDKRTDIALIKINANHPLPTVPLGKSADLQVGDWVIASRRRWASESTSPCCATARKRPSR